MYVPKFRPSLAYFAACCCPFTSSANKLERFATCLRHMDFSVMDLEHLDRVEKFVCDVSCHASTSRYLCERVCLDLRQLLHQPWPQKPRKFVPKSNGVPGNGDVGNHGNETSQEAETLAEVERTLLKAQKARDLHRRLNLLEEIGVDRKIKEPLVEGKQSGDDQPLGDSQPKPSSQLIDGQEFAVISQASLKKLFADVKPLKNNEEVKAKPRPGTAQARAAYSAKVPRPKPAAKSRYRTTYSEIGKNVVAKGKGNSVNSRHSKSNQKHGDKALVESAKSNCGLTSKAADRSKITSIQGNRNLPNSSSRPHGDHKTERLMTDRKQSKSPPECLEKHQENKVLGGKEIKFDSGSSLDSEIKCTEQASNTSGLVKKTEKLKINDSSSSFLSLSKTNNLKADENDESARPFILRRDGCDLKVPTRLKKLHSDVDKLKYKLSSKAPPENTPLPSQHFLHRIESKFNPEIAIPSFSEVHERLTALTTECRHLIEVAKTAVETFPQKGEAFWESRYKAKILTRALEAKLNELKEAFQNIMAEDVTLPSTNPSNCGLRLSISTDPPIPPSVTLFLPTRYRAFQGCIEQLDNHRAGCVKYEYNHLKELLMLATLQHNIQRLSFEICLENLIAEEILPILSSLDPSDGSLVTLYRTVYGLLCHGGHYPAVIRDGVGSATETDPIS